MFVVSGQISERIRTAVDETCAEYFKDLLEERKYTLLKVCSGCVWSKYQQPLARERYYYWLIVRFQVITVESMKMAVFWVVVLCSLVKVYRRFRLHGATTQNTAIFILASY
jgi:hypothetical protein